MNFRGRKSVIRGGGIQLCPRGRPPNPRFHGDFGEEQKVSSHGISNANPLLLDGNSTNYAVHASGDLLNSRGQYRKRFGGRIPKSKKIYAYNYSCSKALENLLAKESYIIAEELLKKNSGYDILLNEQEVNAEKLSLIIKLLHKSVQCRSNTEGTRVLIHKTFESQSFMKKIFEFISEVKFDPNKASEFLSMLVVVMENFLRSTPTSVFETISNVIDLCIGAITHLKRTNPLFVQELEDSYRTLSSLVQECRLNFQKIRAHTRNQKIQIMCLENPSDNFRNLSVTPSLEDLNSTEPPFVRPNIIKGPFKSFDHYLDIQFRLFREDFFRPLREGLQYVKSSESRPKNSDVRIYSNVTFRSSEVKGSEIVYYLKLSLSKYFRIENSKRFMYGNILCISADDFKTMTIASVHCRDKLRNKLIGVHLETESFILKKTEEYTVIESRAYFIAYKYTLSALQNLLAVPLENNIIRVEKKVDPPDYVTWNTSYKLLKRVDKRNVTVEVQVLRARELWPTSNELNFDESQHRAFQGALTRQMAIIQGPPGTGKTYLGLKIILTLILNRYCWSKNEKHPILVVCYTNHALDQFLEGIILFTKKVVRVGKMITSEALKPYSLEAPMSHRRDDDHSIIKEQFFEVRSQCRDLKSQINEINDYLINNEIGILDVKTFDSIIPVKLKPYFGYYESMEYFLLDYFFEECGYPLGKLFWELQSVLLEKSCLMKPKDSDVFEFDDSLLQEEEHDRILSKEDLGESWEPFVSSIHYKFDTTIKKISISMRKIETERLSCKEDSVNMELKYYLQILKEKDKILNLAHAIEWPNEDCQKLEETDYYDLTFLHRWKLYFHWKNKLHDELECEKLVLEERFRESSKRLASLKELEYLNKMKNANVVGMTTTAAARYCDLLHDLAPPIVLVEEAAEIMECHVISSLSQKCQHLILIGDHQQLKPKPTVYELGTKYHLDVSLFERMVRNGVQYETLEYQHRMKPIISNLLVPTIYENLKDHESVMNYPRIKGVSTDLFFLDHEELETNDKEFESFENSYEALLLMGLCRHLILQGYCVKDVTIITPYSGQHRLLRTIQKEPRFSKCVGVRICILDNYQGEENKIILLSLVRSNREEKVGFVKTDNRICVAISRAKHGMYIIGNMTQMAKASELWSQIKEKLLKGGNIGPQLRLSCQNHPKELITVKAYEDFVANSPEGGCKRPCLETFPQCGHQCPRSCHITNMDHSTLNCTAPCPKILCKLGHQCPRLCFEECEPCLIWVERVLPCTHTHLVPCSTNPENYSCPTEVEKILPHCEHHVTMPCHENASTYKCSFPCSARLDCGHQCTLSCHPLEDPDHQEYKCMKKCERKPENCEFEHSCVRRCHEECGICTRLISRNLECGHEMSDVLCGTIVKDLVCQFPCSKMLSCKHPCPMRCGESCGGCSVLMEKTVPECQHEVKVKCCENPKLEHCSSRCIKVLPCSHRCGRKCKEPCPAECTELVPSGKECPRGHDIMVPCNSIKKFETLTESSISLEESKLWKLCTEPCGMYLECDHMCEGQCGKCLNGRLHQTCEKSSKHQLLCGHICESPCNKPCPPCRDKCLWKCSHRKCKNKCGEKCVPCEEKCDRRCEHLICTKKCDEICNQGPCEKPCQTLLKCGHSCIGFCGEPCPPLCRICDKEIVTKIIFGNEDKDDARFVVLADCDHVLEEKGLESLLLSASTPSKGEKTYEIGMKRCPLCCTPICNTKRFQIFIQKSYENVQLVLKKYEKNLPHHLLLLEPKSRNDFMDLEGEFPNAIHTLAVSAGLDRNFKLMKWRKKRGNIPIRNMLHSFQMDFLKNARPLSETLRRRGKNKRLEELIAFVLDHTECISYQTMEEVSSELERLKICCLLDERDFTGCSVDISTKSNLDQIESQMDPTMKFDVTLLQQTVLCSFQNTNLNGHLNITRDISLVQGYWHGCSNGHVFSISAFTLKKSIKELTCPDCQI